MVKIADNNLEANANEKIRGPPCKAGEFGESGKNGKLVKIATTTWRPMQMKRQEGPLVKQSILENLAKMENWSKSATTT